MTLSISIFRRNPDTGEVECLPVLEPSQKVAGVEQARTGLWGSPTVVALGGTFLPMLAEGALWVEREQLDDFQNECERLLLNVTALSGQWNEEYVANRLRNFITSVQVAKEHDAGILID